MGWPQKRFECDREEYIAIFNKTSEGGFTSHHCIKMNLTEEGWENVDGIYMSLLAGCFKKKDGRKDFI